MARCNAVDFDDLLVFAVRLLAEHPHRLAWLRSRWRHVLVDEFQDINHAQAVLIDLLAGPGGNLVVVADDDQLIYGWRGADPSHVLGFGERYPGHARIVLGRNFRSRAEILTAAVRCVEHNARREPKALIAMRGAGGHVEVRSFVDERLEARWIALEIAGAIASGVPGTEILVLARTGYATSALQHALAQAGVPHRVLGSLGLYERAEVRDALAYLALLANPADAQAFRRASSAPRRGIGTATANLVDRWRSRASRRRSDRRQRRARGRSVGSAPGRRVSGSRSSATVSSRSGRRCAPAGRSGTWCSRR